MKRLLIFAFDTFDKLPSNPSISVGKHLSLSSAEDFFVQFEVLPTVMKSTRKHADAFSELQKSIDAFKPHWIIGLGATSRPRVCVEEVALNRIDSPKPDNAGTVFRHEIINSSSPLALSTRVDVKKLVNVLKSAVFPLLFRILLIHTCVIGCISKRLIICSEKSLKLIVFSFMFLFLQLK